MASILDDRASEPQEVLADTHTTDENVKKSQLRKEERLLEFFSRRFRESAVGFEVILRDGSKHSIGAGSPRFKIKITHPKGIRALASFDEGIIANAYINGWFDIQGDIIEMYDLRGYFQDRHLFRWLWRFIAPVLLGQVAVNKSAISRHYERDHSFYLSFLDEEFRCYTPGSVQIT